MRGSPEELIEPGQRPDVRGAPDHERHADRHHHGHTAERERPPWPGPALTWDGRAPLRLPHGTLNYHGPPPPAAWRVSPRRGGERLCLPGRQHHHALKDLLQQHGLPPWERRQLPLLWDADGELLAAGDLLTGARFAAWLNGHGGGLRWLPDLPADG